MYVEDVEWSLRVRAAGYGIVFVPEARVRHKGSGSSGGRASTTNLYYSVRNTIAVSERHAPLPTGLRALRRAVVVGTHLAQAAFSSRARGRDARGDRGLVGRARRQDRLSLTCLSLSDESPGVDHRVGGQDGSLLAELLLAEGHESTASRAAADSYPI